MSQESTRDHLMQAGLNLIQQALSIFDADLNLAVCNRRFQTMFGLPDSLVQPGTPFADTISFLVEAGDYGEVEDATAFVQARVDQALAFEPHYMERVRANGQTISVEGSPLPQGGWVAVYTDISAIKAQERILRSRSAELSNQVLDHAEELSRTNRALKSTVSRLEETQVELTEMERRVRLVTEAAPAHIAHIGSDRRYSYTNHRLTSILPGRPADILGLTTEDALGSAAAARIRPPLERAFQGHPEVLEFTDEESGRRIRTAFTPEIAENGDVAGVFLLSTDVTEEAQARMALAQVQRRELATMLTSGLAHDFSNLLTIILGLQGQLEKLPLPAEARELVAATRVAANRGGALLENIARFSGKPELTVQAVDMEAFLAEFRPMAEATLPSKVGLHIHQTGLAAPILLDVGTLRDGLLNLVLNARDALPSAGGDIMIEVSEFKDRWVQIAVRDTGSGFDDAALQSALNPFFTTKGNRGSGLGLSMVFDHAKLCGGSLRFGNTEEGAEVILRLPIRSAPAVAGGSIVLVVEDEDVLREEVREHLLALGHQVVEASSAAEARALFDLPELGAVLSDIHLKGPETGVDLLVEVENRRPNLSLALMTSLPKTDPLFAKGASRWPVLRKPIDPAALARAFAQSSAA